MCTCYFIFYHFYYIYFFGFGEPNRNNSLHHRRVHMSNPQLPIDHSTAIYQSLHWYHAHVTYCMFILTLWFSKASQEFLCAHRWCGAHTSDVFLSQIHLHNNCEMTLRWTFFALRKTNHGSYLQNRLCLPIYTANLTMVVFRASS
jgi:hypothetical protein